MRKTLLVLLAINAPMIANAYAAADEGTWYAGAKVGWSNYFSVDGDRSFSDNFDDATSFDFNKDNVGAGAFLGYQFNSWLGIEGGYDYLNNLEIGNSETGAKMENQGLQLSLKLSYPFTESWDIYSRAGAMGYRSEVKGGSDSNYETGIRPLVALGTEYAITDNWATRLEYQWTSNIGDKNQVGVTSDNGLLTVGVLYRFGQSEPVVIPVAEPEPAPAEPVTQKFDLKSDVLFAFNSAQLTSEGQAAIQQLYNDPKLKAAGQNTDVVVVGYTDRLGSDSYNQELSQKRAESVADALIQLGMPASAVKAEGRGETESVTGNTCDEVQGRRAQIDCLAPDRRVVVEITGQQTVN